MNTGFIKLHREIQDKPIWALSSPEQKVILITLLMMVNWKPKKWEWMGQVFECKPGQVVTSLDKIAEKGGKGISIKNVRTALKRFEKYNFLANESANGGRVITICNWESYQVNDEEDGKPTGKQPASSGQAAGKQRANGVAPIEEYKKEKERKEGKEKVTANKSRSKKTDFIDSLISEFAAEYKAANNFDYVTTNKGKERSAIGKILREYKNKNPDSDTETTRADLRHYFRMCVNIPDNWMRQNMSLSLIFNKFNEINNILKYGNQARNKQGATDAELASIISKHFATDYKKE